MVRILDNETIDHDTNLALQNQLSEPYLRRESRPLEIVVARARPLQARDICMMGIQLSLWLQHAPAS